MGTWGTSAWDNDSAADWFGALFEKTKLAEYVENALLLDLAENTEIVRAAAYILVVLGRNFIWPAEVHGKHISMAIEKLVAIKEGLPTDEGVRAAIEDEVLRLRSYMPTMR